MDELKARGIKRTILLSRSGILNRDLFILVHTRINFLAWRNIPTIEFGRRCNKTERRKHVPVTSRVWKDHRDSLTVSSRDPPNCGALQGLNARLGRGMWGTGHFICRGAALPAFAGRSLPASACYRSHRAEDHVNYALTTCSYLFLSIKTKLLGRHISTGAVNFLPYSLKKSFRPCPAEFLRSEILAGVTRLTSDRKLWNRSEQRFLLLLDTLSSDRHGLAECGKRRCCGRFQFVLLRDVRFVGETLTRSKSDRETFRDGLRRELIHRDL